MGLDMYIFREIKLSPEEETELLLTGNDRPQDEELAYWRKYYDLNEYILSNYYEGTENGNTEHVYLDKDAIEDIYNFIMDDEPERGTEFYKEALYALKNGSRVYYWAWW